MQRPTVHKGTERIKQGSYFLVDIRTNFLDYQFFFISPAQPQPAGGVVDVLCVSARKGLRLVARVPSEQDQCPV